MGLDSKNFNEKYDDTMGQKMGDHSLKDMEYYISSKQGIKGKVFKFYHRLKDLRFNVNDKTVLKQIKNPEVTLEKFQEILGKLDSAKTAISEVDLRKHHWEELEDVKQEIGELKELEKKSKKLANLSRILGRTELADSFKQKKQEIKESRIFLETAEKELKPLRKLDPKNVFLAKNSELGIGFRKFLLENSEPGINEGKLSSSYQKFISTYISEDPAQKSKAFKELADGVPIFHEGLQSTYIPTELEEINIKLTNQKTSKDLEKKLSDGEIIHPKSVDEVPDLSINIHAKQINEGSSITSYNNQGLKLDELPEGVDAASKELVELKGPCKLKIHGREYDCQLENFYINPQTKELFTFREDSNQEAKISRQRSGTVNMMLTKKISESKLLDDASQKLFQLDIATSTEVKGVENTLRGIAQLQNKKENKEASVATIVNGYLVTSANPDDKIYVIRKNENETQCIDVTEEKSHIHLMKLEKGDKVFMLNKEVHRYLDPFIETEDKEDFKKQELINIVRREQSLDDMNQALVRKLNESLLAQKLNQLSKVDGKFTGEQGNFISVEYQPAD